MSTLCGARARCYGRPDVATARECPLCGGTMRIVTSEQIVRVPGNPQPVKKISKEWVCPECDYFEEADEDRM